MTEQRTPSRLTTVVGGVACLALLAAPAVAITRASASDTRPTAIEVTYSYESAADGTTLTEKGIEQMFVHGAFDSQRIYDGVDSGGAMTHFLAIQSFATSSTRYLDQTTTMVSFPRAAGFFGTSTLRDMETEGNVVHLGRKTVVGRECNVIRSNTDPTSGLPVAPTSTDYVEACYTPSGIDLEETVISGGTQTNHAIATSVDEAPSFATDAFAPLPSSDASVDTANVLTEIDAGSAPTPRYWRAGAPSGMHLMGRYRFQDMSGLDPVTSYADVYVDDTSAVIVRQGPLTADPSDESAAMSSSKLLTVGTIGKVVETIDTGQSHVKAYPADDWFVDVSGTVSKAEIKRIAAGLRNG